MAADFQRPLKRYTAPAGGALPGALLIFAHPDDETIALGARIHRFGDGLLVHVTDGAPRNGHDSSAHGFATLADYRAARFAELDEALSLAGARNLRRQCLGIADQEASLELAELTRSVRRIIDKTQPEVIFTHAYEGGHPDHDACAFAVHQAVESSTGPKSLVVECALYHAGVNGIKTGAFLPCPPPFAEIRYALSPEEQTRKRAMLHAFTSQRATLAQFGVEKESFRVAPQYDFTQPPHEVPVYYDRYAWGMTSERFCKLARAAQHELSNRAEAACL